MTSASPRKGKTRYAEIRQALADYMAAEGCSCCRDDGAHRVAEERLAKLLRVPAYADKSGYDFNRFVTKSRGRPGRSTP